jgi:hypothetical protein
MEIFFDCMDEDSTMTVDIEHCYDIEPKIEKIFDPQVSTKEVLNFMASQGS